jgi:hypothetical protein
LQADPRSRDLVARVAHLEGQQQVLRPLAAVTMIVTVAALVAFTTREPSVVQAQRLELVTSKGVTQAALAADSAGVRLTLYDGSGRVAASLQLNDDPRLTVRDANGREVAALGAVRVQHLAQ